jgi:tRNA threonylcarbamoyladenosine biosynthesis protein TsaE
MEQEFNAVAQSTEALPEIAENLLRFAGNRKVFLFDAQMGAGKTTFIKQLCKTLGSNDNFSSPSFSIINEYSSPSGQLYHFDLYRIKHLDELYDLGIEEYLDSGAYCFVEWPELLQDMVKAPVVKVSITTIENSRYFRAQKI